MIGANSVAPPSSYANGEDKIKLQRNIRGLLRRSVSADFLMFVMLLVMRYLSLLLFFLAPPLLAQELSGRVVAVESGDTLAILDAQRRQMTVRLIGADAPERTQPFGPQSRANLSMLVFNREVVLTGDRRDGQGRRLMKVLVADANCTDPACPKRNDVGLAQIQSGMAWWDRAASGAQSLRDREDYGQAEFTAKLRRFGLWSGKNPVPPWEWRGR